MPNLKAANAPAMKALVCERYGDPEAPGILRLRNWPRPQPAKNEVQIKVHCSSVNDYDWAMVRGKPWLYRLIFGLRKPKHPIGGMELSGTVTALGRAASAFELGDEVYGDISGYGFGSFAQYVCVPERAVKAKPSAMSFEEAAALPHASMLAYQALYKTARLRDGMQLLINGAGGGVGTLALQMAKNQQVEVTGVDSGAKLEMMRSLGFDHLIDYRQQDFSRLPQRYDVIIDTKTMRSPFAYRRVLKPTGTYVSVGGQLSRLLQLLISTPLISREGGRSFKILALKPNQDLHFVEKLFEAGKIRPLIDGPYPFEKLPWAIRYFGEARHQGKVIIRLPE